MEVESEVLECESCGQIIGTAKVSSDTEISNSHGKLLITGWDRQASIMLSCNECSDTETIRSEVLHPNPSMRTLQLLAAGETIDIVKIDCDEANRNERMLATEGTVVKGSAWVNFEDMGGNPHSVPTRRVKEIDYSVTIPEVYGDE